MSFEVFMQVWCLQKSKLWWKQGKTGEKSQDSAKFALPIPLVRNFRTTHPLCEFAFVPIFKNACSQSLPKISVRISQECEPCANLVRIRFCDKISNHALCHGEPQECEIFAQPISLCEIRTSSLKAIFSSLILSFFFFNSLNTSLPITHFHP